MTDNSTTYSSMVVASAIQKYKRHLDSYTCQDQSRGNRTKLRGADWLILRTCLYDLGTTVVLPLPRRKEKGKIALKWAINGIF